MEEIDGIILDSLRNLNCDFAEDITSLKQFDPDLIAEALSKCLQTILPQATFPSKLPPSMSLKLKFCTNLATQIRELGFRGDIGYQSILYSNEGEIRRIFMFLIERLPRDGGKISVPSDQTGYVPSTVKAIGAKMRESLNSFWLPSAVLNRGCRRGESTPFVHSLGGCAPIKTSQLRVPDRGATEELKDYHIHNLPAVTQQCPRGLLLPSLLFQDSELPWDDSMLKRCLHVQNKADVTSPKHQLLENQRQELINEDPKVESPLKNNKFQDVLGEITQNQERLTELQNSVQSLDHKLNQALRAKGEEEEHLAQTLSQITLKNKTLTVLSKEENYARLKNMIDTSKTKLLNLAKQWHEIQQPLLEEYKSLQNTLCNEDLHVQKLRKIDETHQSLLLDAQTKSGLEEELRTKLAQLSKTHNRSGYTRRILEIIGNIKKQDDEILKILNDTKAVQQEIQTLTGRVDRSFTSADELIFQDAKHDETARKAYKLLAQLRDDFSDIIRAVTDLGNIERESRNQQEQIDVEIAKDSAVKLERVTRDLDEVRKEIATFK